MTARRPRPRRRGRRWVDGRRQRAVAKRALKEGGNTDKAEAFAAGYRQGKLKGACTNLIELLKGKSQIEYVSPYEVAMDYALIGDRDHTFEWLEKAYRERSGRMEYLKAEDFIQPFHSDPRYVDLLRRMGLPQ